MKIKDMINSQTVHNVAMTLFTFFLVLFSFLTWHTIDRQTSISEELKDMQIYQNEQRIKEENQKTIQEKKKLKIIIENILGLFSPKGINEREQHSKQENIELSNEFYRYLFQGLDNYLIANDEECLINWMNAINGVYLYADKYNNMTLNALPDKDFNEMFLIHIERSWKSVFQVYIKFNLANIAFENNGESSLNITKK